MKKMPIFQHIVETHRKVENLERQLRRLEKLITKLVARKAVKR